MSMMKKKTRKAIRKTVKKLINKHGPTVVSHLGAALATGLAAYVSGEPEHKRKKHLKKLRKMPRKIVAAMRAVPGVTEVAEQLTTSNGSGRSKGRKHAGE